MCLTYVMSKKNRTAWLKDKPKIITAYKTVAKCDGKYYPLDMESKHPFKLRNRLRKVNDETVGRKIVPTRIESRYTPPTTYVAYYHLWETRVGALAWACDEDFIIECQVPKHFITDIGWQNSNKVIISRGFDIVGEC